MGERLEKLMSIHDQKILGLEASTTDTYFLAPSSPLAARMLETFKSWQKQRPEKGPHPQGHVKLMLTAALLDIMVKQHIPEDSFNPEVTAEAKLFHADALKIRE